MGNFDEDQIVKRVMAAKVNERVNLADLCLAEFVTFDHGTDGYSWTSKHKGGIGHFFPMKSTHMVRTFKTLAGAKRNFIRRTLRRSNVNVLFKEVGGRGGA